MKKPGKRDGSMLRTSQNNKKNTEGKKSTRKRRGDEARQSIDTPYTLSLTRSHSPPRPHTQTKEVKRKVIILNTQIILIQKMNNRLRYKRLENGH